jgi:hypothetical protein
MKARLTMLWSWTLINVQKEGTSEYVRSFSSSSIYKTYKQSRGEVQSIISNPLKLIGFIFRLLKL